MSRKASNSAIDDTVILRIRLNDRVRKSIVVPAGASVAEARSSILRKLCRETHGAITVGNLAETMKQYELFDLHRAYNSNTQYRILLQPHNKAVYYSHAGQDLPDELLFMLNVHRAKDLQIEGMKDQLRAQRMKVNAQLQRISHLALRGKEEELQVERLALDKEREKLSKIEQDVSRMQRENAVMDGAAYLSYDHDNTQLRFWFRLIEDAIHLYINENDEEAYGVIPLVAPSCSVIYRPRSPMSFSLHTMYDEDAVDYSITTESEEITWAWMGSISYVAKVTILTGDSVKPSDKKRAVLGRVRSRKNTMMSHARTLLQEKRLEGVIRPQYSSDLSVIATVHSVGLARSVTLKEVTEGGETFQTIASGCVGDLFVCLMFCCTRPGENNTELRDLMLHWPTLCEPEDVVGALEEAWEVLERSNWVKVTREQTVRLLGNFAEQVLCSPDVGEPKQNERLRLLVQGFASQRLPEVDWVSLKYTQLPPLPTVETDMGLFKGASTIFDFPCAVIASQMTLSEIQLMRSMSVSEFVRVRWQKRKELSPNVIALSDRFNRIVRSVTTMLLGAPSPKESSRRLKKLILTAHHLFKIRNYNSCYQILSGLTHSTVTKQKWFTAAIASEKYSAVYTLLIDSFSYQSNFKAYRDLPHEAPCIPLMLVMLRDIVYLYDGLPKWADEENEVLNWNRILQISKAIYSIGFHMHEATDYTPIRDIPLLRSLIDEAPQWSDEEFYAHADQADSKLKPSSSSSSKMTKQSSVSVATMLSMIEDLQHQVESLNEWKSTRNAPILSPQSSPRGEEPTPDLPGAASKRPLRTMSALELDGSGGDTDELAERLDAEKLVKGLKKENKTLRKKVRELESRLELVEKKLAAPPRPPRPACSPPSNPAATEALHLNLPAPRPERKPQAATDSMDMLELTMSPSSEPELRHSYTPHYSLTRPCVRASPRISAVIENEEEEEDDDTLSDISDTEDGDGENGEGDGDGEEREDGEELERDAMWGCAEQPTDEGRIVSPRALGPSLIGSRGAFAAHRTPARQAASRRTATG